MLLQWIYPALGWLASGKRVFAILAFMAIMTVSVAAARLGSVRLGSW